MMNLLKFQYLFVLTFLFQVCAIAQNWVSYESEQQINDLVDAGGNLYMATDAGLVVMNKSTLGKSIFNTNNSNLTSNHIETITQASNGDIWIGTYDVSIARFDGTDFVDFMVPPNPEILNWTNLFDLEIAANGDFWLGTSVGIVKKQGTNWILYDEDDLGPDFFEIWDIELNASGDVFAAGFELYKFSGGVWSNLIAGTPLDGSFLAGYLDAEIYFANDGTLYLAGDLSKIARYDGSSWILDSIGITINNFEGGMFTEDLAGDVYFNTKYSGIYKLGSISWDLYSDAQIMAYGDRTNYYYIDSQGDRWLNKNIHLSVDKNGTIENTMISNSTLETSGTINLHLGDNGSMYFITSSQENFSVLDQNGNWAFLEKPTISGLNYESFKDFLALADNDIWLSSSYGLYHFDGNAWTGYPLGACSNFTRDSQGKIYVLAQDKIHMIENNVFTEYTSTNSGITDYTLLGHGIDADDNLWIAAGGFINYNLIQKRSSDGTWDTYLETDYPILKRPTGDFVFDNDGNMWVTDDQYGAIKFDGTTFTNPVADNASLITTAEVTSVNIDVEGSLYFSHQYGLTKLKEGVWESLDIENVPNGFSSSSSNIEIDNEGTLWWASNWYGVFSYKLDIVNGLGSNLEWDYPISVFPNPSTDVINLEVELEVSASLTANLYNSMGQLFGTYAFGETQAGKHQKSIEVADLARGVYHLQLQIDDQFAVKTLLLK
ncbi:MAG: ligand-binding sensor domain-containing protein [Chitinophagales bacterium]|jgi:ligand-binding sensor domain-containing protein